MVTASYTTYRGTLGERFGVSAASIRRWRKRAREQSDPRPGALGGDRRSQAIEEGLDLVGLGGAAERRLHSSPRRPA